MPALRVGIDFDNTLICYEQTFWMEAVKKDWLPEDDPKSKSQVKAFLVEEDGNDLRWQELQSIVYGSEVILTAPFFAGVIQFFKTFQNIDVELFIVSHKSKYSNFDQSRDLRYWATKWMKQNKITDFIPSTNINFAETLDEKIKKINSLNCHFFIDDLEKVFTNKYFNKKCNQILFNHPSQTQTELLQYDNWTDISFFLQQQYSFLQEKGFILNPLTILKREGNNRLYQGQDTHGESLILKSYSTNEKDERKRGLKETKAYKFLKDHNYQHVPDLHYHDSSLNFSCLSFAEGKLAKEATYHPWMGDQMVNFILKLDELYQEDSEFPHEFATDNRSCLSDYTRVIEKRFYNIYEGLKHSPELCKEFTPIVTELLNYKELAFSQFNKKILHLSFSKEKKLKKSELTLSPSDFGLHNMKVDQSTACFFDFEYFGIDDPAKLWADFYHHIGFELDKKERLRLIKSYAASTQCEGFHERIQLVDPLIQLEWILIVLNICQKGSLERKLYTNPEEKRQSLIKSRLQRARTMLSFLGKSHSIQL